MASAVGGNYSSLNPDDRDDRLVDRVYMVYRRLFSVVCLSPTFETSSGGLRGSVNVLK